MPDADLVLLGSGCNGFGVSAAGSVNAGVDLSSDAWADIASTALQ